jgi:hypothetical protein
MESFTGDIRVDIGQPGCIAISKYAECLGQCHFIAASSSRRHMARAVLAGPPENLCCSTNPQTADTGKAVVLIRNWTWRGF